MHSARKTLALTLCLGFAAVNASAQSGRPTGICHYRSGGTGPCLPEESSPAPAAPNVDYGAARQLGETLVKKLFNGDSRNASQLNNQGVSLYEQGRYDDAAQAFRKALQYEPENAVFQNNLKYALAMVRESRSKSEQDAAIAMSRQGDAELAKGHLEQAAELYQHALEKYPNPSTRKNLENVQAMLGVIQTSAEPSQDGAAGAGDAIPKECIYTFATSDGGFYTCIPAGSEHREMYCGATHHGRFEKIDKQECYKRQ